MERAFMFKMQRSLVLSAAVFASFLFNSDGRASDVASVSFGGRAIGSEIVRQSEFTKISDLPREEKVRMLGAPLSEVRTDGSYGLSLNSLESAFPESFDWRSVKGIDYVSPVKNQGRCGSCVAFAAASTFETQLNIETNSVLHGWDFSTQHLFSCGGGSCSSGWFPGSAAQFLIKKGVPEFACFPYLSGALGKDFECKQSCSDSKLRSQKASLRTRSKAMRSASVDEVKAALMGGPLMTTMRVYDDFYSYSGGVYRRKEGPLLGGHAVMIIGWSNSEKAWIARNSWGTDWGDKGDFKIAWDDVSGVGSSFWGFQSESQSSAVVLEGLKDTQVVTNPTRLVGRFHNLAVVDAQLEFSRSGNTVHTLPMSDSGEFILDPKDLIEGAHTVQIRARVGTGESASERISQAKLFYILRSKPEASIQIERMKSGMNVWETIVPVFAVSSRPIPLGAVQYRITNASGDEVRRRRTEHTSDRVGMSLSPRGLAMGRYTLIAEALSSNNEVLASTSLDFNIIEK
jgi:hypothetical protein